MTQRKAQRFAAAFALAGILFLVAAPVQARDLGPAPHAWQWIQDLWTKGAFFLWSWGEPAAPTPEISGDLRKQGPGVDPNGSPSSGSGSNPPANPSGDVTGGSDPNG
jgi:hypothetical protein